MRINPMELVIMNVYQIIDRLAKVSSFSVRSDNFQVFTSQSKNNLINFVL
ncbi:MAG: hypothetical protein ACRC2R_12040 [Xenococcaceae cyanobacterium]